MNRSHVFSSLLRIGVGVALLAVCAAPLLADAVDVSVPKGAQDQIAIQYAFDAPRMTAVMIDGREYVELSLGQEPLMKEVGAPALPHACRSLHVPDIGHVTLQVVSAEYYEIEGLDVISSRGFISRTVNPADVPYTFGKVYATDAFYPGEIATLRAPYIMRDCRGVVLDVNPLQYNPVTRTLRVYTDVSVEVVTRGAGGINELDRSGRDSRASASFEAIYHNQFINYEPPGDRYDPLDEEGDMLIIAHDAWISNVQPLADHKTSIGINATVVGVSTIPGGNNATAIKNYIQTVYDSSDLAFVLLVGDGAQIDTPSASGGSSDPSYSKLAGGDDYPDVLVGRFSAESPGDVDTQVERTIEYEQNAATLQDWFWRGMGVASNQGPGDDDEYDDEHIGYIRDDLLAYGHTVVDEIYDYSGTAAQVTAGLNAGRGIINYCGHGSTTSWGSTGFSNSDVNALVNDNMLPFIVSVACVNGQFDGYTCFGEAWLRATHNGEPTGAIGAYMSSINQSWDPPMEGQDEFNLLFVAEQYVTYGALCFAGSCSMMDEYGSGGVSMFDTWHIFGDPSVRVVGTTAPPTGMKVSPGSGLVSEGPNGGPFTPDELTYTLTNYEAYPLEYSVAHSALWVDVSSTGGTIPALGEAYVTVSINGVADTLGNGHYEDVVSFVNETNHDGDTTRTMSLDVGVPMPVHVFPLDFQPMGWTMTGEWAFGVPTGQGGTSHGSADPDSGATGSNVFGVNLNGDYSTTAGGPYFLTTAAIDCSELTQVGLHFQRWLNTDYQSFVFATLEVSNDGLTWTMLWENGSSEVTASSWSEQAYDISGVADNQPTVYVRWGYEIGSGAWAYSGWNVDDVEIWGIEPSGPQYPIGDMNCDMNVNVFDIDPFVLALTGQADYEAEHPGCQWMLADCNGDGVVNVFDIDSFVLMAVD